MFNNSLRESYIDDSPFLLGNSVSSENLRYLILKMSCLKHLNMSIWSQLLAQRCCHIGLRQSHLLRREHSDLLALGIYSIRLCVHIKKTIISLKSSIITMFFRLDTHNCVRMLTGIFCSALFRVTAL